MVGRFVSYYGAICSHNNMSNMWECSERKGDDTAYQFLFQKKHDWYKPKQDSSVFLLQITEQVSNSPFFLYLAANGRSALNTLDDFLRKIWLECCGHLSAFKYPGRDAYRYGGGDFGIPMSRKLESILNKGQVLEHLYDFGTTTDLFVKVLDVIPEIELKKRGIQLLARNDMPVVNCMMCDKSNATLICSFCGEVFCESCKSRHECCIEENCEENDDYYMLLPFVNSPRTGQCGYDGGV